VNKKEILKKGTDVLEVVDSSEDYRFLIKADSKDGKRLLAALEAVAGSPALDEPDNVVDLGEPETMRISRYRLKEDVELENDA
jgi:hypothetical protein